MLIGLVRHPIARIVRRWNWKSALLSSLFRATIFFTANLSAGLDAAYAAMLTELVFRGITSGFYGGLTQSFRHATPHWLASIAMMVLLPFCTHVSEFLVHWLRGTERLAESLTLSVAFTVISTLFNLFAMRRGVLIVGEGRGSLLADLRQIPRLIVLFRGEPPVPIKTLHLTNAYHPSSGGIRTFYRAMLAAANAERRFMRLVVPADQSSVEEVGEFGRIYHVRAPRSPWVDSRYRLILPQAFLSPGGEVRRILAAEQPDLVEVCDKYSLCYAAGALRRGWLNGAAPADGGGPELRAARRQRARLDVGPPDRAPLRRLVHRPRLHRPVRRPSRELGIHRARAARAHGDQTPPRSACRADGRHGRRSRAVAPQRRICARSFIGSPEVNSEATLLLYAGRLSPEKNLSLLIDMMARLGGEHGRPPRRLIVAGDGPSARRAAAGGRTARARPRLFYGHVGARDTLARLYASCDVFVHPNPREPFGIGPLEAMASGAPLVAPAAGGLLSYANETNAWLAEPTGEAFAAAVRAACRPGPRRDARLACARETAAGYAWPNVTRAIFELYDQLHAGPVVPCRVPSRHVNAICP